MAEVYVLTFPNGKQYVGRTKKTADVRFRNHVRDSQKSKMPVHRAIRKFGAENVKVAILADGLSWSESAKVEIAWIAKLGTMMPGGYNLTAGGEGRLGCPASEAVRAAVAAANRRRRGKPLSEANRQGIAEATRRRWQDPVQRPGLLAHCYEMAEKRKNEHVRSRVR